MRLWPGGVAQARAIGDADVGHYIDAEPACRTTPFPSGGFTVAVCSDGIWDAMSLSSVSTALQKTRDESAAVSAAGLIEAAARASHRIDSNGTKRPKDDTTCCILHVRHLDGNAAAAPQHGSPSHGGGLMRALRASLHYVSPSPTNSNHGSNHFSDSDKSLHRGSAYLEHESGSQGSESGPGSCGPGSASPGSGPGSPLQRGR